MTRVPGAGARTWLGLLAVCLAVWSAGDPAVSFARQDATTAPAEVGAGPVRERSLALVGRSVYGSDSVVMAGYLTAVIGLFPELLFTGGAPSEQTARFTYFGEVPLSSSTNRGDVTVFDGDGVVSIYFDDDGGATWDDPASFAAGQPVAELSVRLQSTLQRQAPGVGVVVGDGQVQQVTANEFAIDGERYRFGQNGIEGRLRTVGALLDDGAAQSPGQTVALTGSLSVVDRETIPVVMGIPEA